MFSVNELATAVKYGLGVVFLVLNDQRYGAIKYLQEGIFGKYGEVDLANPDFPAMARAFGAEAVRAEGIEDLPRALDRALRHQGPTVLELRMAVEPPWGSEGIIRAWSSSSTPHARRASAASSKACSARVACFPSPRSCWSTSPTA